MPVTLGILLVALLTATWTDVSRRKIYNWTTYPGILGCLLAASWETGWAGFVEALIGGLICGGLMFVCYLCLDVGGGDVKLAALMGVEEDWLNAAFEQIDSSWGSFDNYVREGLGLSEADVARLKQTLLSNPSTAHEPPHTPARTS